jgi:hypothetical protein
MNAVTKLREPKEATAEVATDPLAKMREPFPPHQISKLPKESKAQIDERKNRQNSAVCQVCGSYHHRNAVHLDYVGHAALTDRLLDADPRWNWEPMALTPEGLPAFDKHGGLWIKLTVDGVTRIGYGCADGKAGGDAIKEIIGDALRNSGMRFGAALELWHKGDLHAEEDPGPTLSAEQLAINHLRSCSVDGPTFKGAWEANKAGWRDVMEPDAYARVVAEMKKLAAKFKEPEPPPPPPTDDFGIGEDEIPY